MTVAITPLATYRNETPYPFCPGCGHGVILNHLNEAGAELFSRLFASELAPHLTRTPAEAGN